MNAIISRDVAAKDGKKRFYTGKPCKKGHDSERYTSTGGCIECLHPVINAAAEETYHNVYRVGLIFPVGTPPEAQALAAKLIQDTLLDTLAKIDTLRDPASKIATTHRFAIAGGESTKQHRFYLIGRCAGYDVWRAHYPIELQRDRYVNQAALTPGAAFYMVATMTHEGHVTDEWLAADYDIGTQRFTSGAQKLFKV